MELDQQVQKLREFIEASQRILITSHISPDPDALSSLVLLGSTLNLNFPQKQIVMALEEEPIGLDFVDGYKDISFGPIIDAVTNFGPHLLTVVDANNFERCSRQHGENLRQLVREKSVSTVIIDHHEPAGRDEADVYINQNSPATAQDVYEVCFKHLNLESPSRAAQTAMLGIYADTGGFVYTNGRHSATFALVDELVSAGANIEAIKNRLEQYSQNDMAVFAELAANVRSENDFSYSFLRDEFVAQWLKSGKTPTQLHKGTEAFVNGFIRNIGGRQWGFIVYKNVLQGDSYYSASFRAVGSAKDVSLVANQLGGGGHKPAAGAKFQATSVQEAIEKIKRTISGLQPGSNP